MSIPWSKEQLMIANQKLMEKNQKYKQALEFYADEGRYEFEIDISTSDIDVKSEILTDYGDKARQALRGDRSVP